MTTQAPDATPTPKPWESEELSVRESLHRLGSHVIERLTAQDHDHEHVSKQVADLDRKIGAMADGIRLEIGNAVGEAIAAELRPIKEAVIAQSRAIRQLTEKEAVTGTYIVQAANLAGRAEGKADAAMHQHRRSSDPVQKIASGVLVLIIKHGPVWIWRIAPLLVAGVMYVLHRAGLLGH